MMLLRMWYFLPVIWLSNVFLSPFLDSTYTISCYICCCRCQLKGQVWSSRVDQVLWSPYITRGGLGMACFSFLEACRMGRCLLMIFIKPVSLGWYVGHSVVVVAVGGIVGLVDGV